MNKQKKKDHILSKTFNELSETNPFKSTSRKVTSQLKGK
jgi:hypothetical protein